jgi:kynurenine/2-aminoadipate aminotransferase
VSQALVAGLFETWDSGRGGFLERWAGHVEAVADIYRRRRDAFLRSADRHLAGLCDWSTPAAGMFCWIRLRGVADAAALVRTTLVKDHQVLFVPGSDFYPDASRPSPYIRASYSTASYSTASEADMDEALKRLATVLRELK